MNNGKGARKNKAENMKKDKQTIKEKQEQQKDGKHEDEHELKK